MQYFYQIIFCFHPRPIIKMIAIIRGSLCVSILYFFRRRFLICMERYKFEIGDESFFFQWMWSDNHSDEIYIYLQFLDDFRAFITFKYYKSWVFYFLALLQSSDFNWEVIFRKMCKPMFPPWFPLFLRLPEKSKTDVAINAYIGLLLCSTPTHIHDIKLHIEMTR